MDQFQQNNNQQNQFVQQPYPQNQNVQQNQFAQQPYPQSQNMQQGQFVQQPYPQNQNVQQNQFAQQPVNNQYYQPATGQYIQPGYNQYGQMYPQNMNAEPRRSVAKNVVALVFGIIGLIFSFPTASLLYEATHVRRYSVYGYSYYARTSIASGAIVVFIFEFVFLLLGFLFGLLGMCGKTRGKGMGIAGFICTIVGIIFLIIGAVSGAFN